MIKVERLGNESIIVAVWRMPVDPIKEAPGMFAQIDALIKPSEKIVLISDMRDIKMDFHTLVNGMTANRADVPGSPSDPRIHSILVGSGMFWDIAAKGARKLHYDIPLYESMDEALAHAREKIKSW